MYGPYFHIQPSTDHGKKFVAISQRSSEIPWQNQKNKKKTAAKHKSALKAIASGQTN